MTGVLKFKNISAYTIRYQINHNGTLSGWKEVQSGKTEEIEFSAEWDMDCGYLNDEGELVDGSYTLHFEYLASQMWYGDISRWEMTCSKCDRFGEG